jgi:glycine oxidase
VKTVIVGNGIIGLMIAYRLLSRDSQTTVTIVGPQHHRGCASLAAAAMFNSFCEVDPGTLSNKFEREKFLFNKAATPYWPSLLDQIQNESDSRLEFGFGTFLVNNHTTDELEDETFDAVVAALREFDEPFENASATDIPHYRPSPKSRAARAIFIPREGWVNPVLLIGALKRVIAVSGRAEFIDDNCRMLRRQANRVSEVVLDGGRCLSAEAFVLSPGATFSRIISQSDLGLNMPRVFYGVGCSILLLTGDTTLPNCVRTPNRGLACGIYAAPQNATNTIIGASNFICAEPEDYPRITSVHTLLQGAMEQINVDYYRSQLVKVNVGWRPTSEDTLPLLGATSLANLYVATGTKRDGLHCAPLISEVIADLVLEGRSATNVDLFSPERPPARVLSREEAIAKSVSHMINAAYQHGFTPAKDRMVEEMRRHFREDLERLHDQVGAIDWGIPPEMINMYKYGHAR